MGVGKGDGELVPEHQLGPTPVRVDDVVSGATDLAADDEGVQGRVAFDLAVLYDITSNECARISDALGPVLLEVVEVVARSSTGI